MAMAVFDSPPSRRGDSPRGVRIPLVPIGSYRIRPAADTRLGASSSTRAVTRVESFTSAKSGEFKTSISTKSVAKIDWLNATFCTPANFADIGDFIRYVGSLLGRPISARADGGLFGFDDRFRMESRLDDGSKVEIGSVACGGESQRGRWLLQLTGKGCGLVKDWPGLQRLLLDLDAKVTRVDLAVDFLKGEYSVDDAIALYQDGAFISRGRNPELDIQGAWHEGGTKGRTVYVGKLKNGKTLCVYEKGRQLNMKDSDWTRYEVRLGNRDRVIPLDVLTNPDKYFAGAYPALTGMLESAADEIPTQKEELNGTLAHSLFHAKRCYGKYFHQVLQATDCDVSDLVEEIRVIGMPGRLDPAVAMAGIEWRDLQTQLRSMTT